MAKDDFVALNRRIDQAIADLLAAAQRDFDERLTKAKAAFAAGDKRTAQAQMQAVIDRFGLDDFVRRARSAKDGFQ